MSQIIRKRVEECFGWAKVIGGIRKVRVTGIDRVSLAFDIVCGTFNLVRLGRLYAG